MKKIQMNIKNFFYQIMMFKKDNRSVFVMNMISLMIVISYFITNIFPHIFKEMFLGADFIFSTISTIAISCLASSLFFIIQIYIPDLHKNRLRKKDAAEDLLYIMKIMQHMHEYIQLWNYGDIEEDKQQPERFDIAISYLKDSYTEIICEIKKFKSTYYDICSEKAFDFLSSIQRDPDFKMFNQLAGYRNWSNCNDLVFSNKAKDILMRYSLEFQNIDDGWLIKEDSERIATEFKYRHISLYGMMCEKEG